MLLLGRDRLFKYVKELDPIGLYNRTSSFTRRRGTYTTPGPDFCWSMDAHCKLEDFGSKYTAAIDAGNEDYFRRLRPNQGDPIDTEYIKALNETTKGWKIHEYLPKTTIEFCKDILRREGFPSGRAAPANFVQSLGKEEHEIAKWKPTSTSDEVLDLYKEHAEDEDQLLELNELFGDMAQLDFEGDGVDEEAAPEEFYQAYVEDWEDEDD
ncbi:unnamed protein product [Zymoseptoria tritici ST99CH_1E4]|uniref:Uncharacterized protein n=1 Tax=Zymoseptoria tritici ST99CH_1E4 TaxID=1276532 RepID=A0A2H1GNA0_ZYMTR|nr:unnamed protein product [Zymoseptoria tritici ST99CH_1E4]